MGDTLFGREAIARRLGLQDSRGPQGMFSRGSNVYRGGAPMAQSGSGNPNMGRPSTQPVDTGFENPPPSMTALVGSLPPNSGNPDRSMNDAVMNLLRMHFGGRGGVSA